MMKKCMLFLFIFSTSYSVASDDVSLTLEGYIKAKCGFTMQENDLQFPHNGLISTELVINCNSPMRMSLHSEHGGLLHLQGRKVNGYRVSLSVAGLSLSESFLARNLIDSHTLNIDQILFKKTMNLQLELTEPLIYAGEYRDILRIEMTPAASSGGIW